MQIEILLETSDYLVINKPAGLMVHGDARTTKPTLVDWILEHYPGMKGVGEPMRVQSSKLKVESEEDKITEQSSTLHPTVIDRPGIVHRLDEETSGVLIVAKTALAFAHFKEQFMNRTVQKEYHAFVWGHFKELVGVIDMPIGRNATDFRKRHAGRGVRGATKEAVTQWKAIAQFEEIVDGISEKFSFMHLFPKTGRTHQLRVHMKYLQRPIVSDMLYAPTKPFALGFSRVALHARTITFTDIAGGVISVEAPYPPDFASAVQKMEGKVADTGDL